MAGQVAVMQGAHGRACKILEEAYSLAQSRPFGSCYFEFGSLVEQYSRSLVALGQVGLGFRVSVRILSFGFTSDVRSWHMSVDPMLPGTHRALNPETENSKP